MKKTALTHIHESLGAKIIPFAGYNMPVQYEGVVIEHETVRNNVGIFDVSHMGEIFLKGKNALALIQKITTNDASKIEIGKAQYTCLPNYNGGIVDDLIIYRLAELEYLLVVNASNIEKDWNWIIKHNDFDVTIENRSDEYSLFAIQGPKAIEAMQSLTVVDLNSIPYYSFKKATFAGKKEILISATGYTGSGGFEIYLKNEDAQAVWEAIFEAGSPYGIKPIGLAARDTLRLEMGFCLYGNDINDTTSPIEAGLSWITKFNKDFINSEKLKLQKEKGVLKKLIGFELLEKGIPRQNYDILNEKKDKIGVVTSGTMSPSLNKGIGMGYVETPYSDINTIISIQIRKNIIPARVVKVPFYKK